MGTRRAGWQGIKKRKREDVVFNGTKFRKPLNIAEVAVTIQNNKKGCASDWIFRIYRLQEDFTGAARLNIILTERESVWKISRNYLLIPESDTMLIP